MEIASETKISKTTLLIGVLDIDGFTRLSRSMDPVETFQYVCSLTEKARGILAGAGGTLIKVVGDSLLVIFPSEKADAGIKTLMGLKRELESYSRSLGREMTLSVTAHIGEAAVGTINGAMDIMGKEVNTAHTLNSGHQHGRGRLVLSPQAFRGLEPETRKAFHKFTPPIVYLAE